MARRTESMRIGRSDPVVEWGVEAKRAAQAQSLSSRAFIYWTVQRANVFARQQRRKTTVLRYARTTPVFIVYKSTLSCAGHSKRFSPFGGIPRPFARFPVPFFYLSACVRERTIARCRPLNQCRSYERASGVPSAGPHGLRETPASRPATTPKKDDEQKKIGTSSISQWISTYQLLKNI